MASTRPKRHLQVAPNGTPAEQDALARARFRLLPPVPGSASTEPENAPLDVDVPGDALIAAIVAGETDALGVLYDRYGHAVFALIVRIVGDRGTAEDLLQEVFLHVWQQARTFDGARGTVRSWLHGIAHHLALNELRRRRRRPQLLTPPARDGRIDEDGPAAYVDPVADPAGDAWRAVRDATMARALAELSEAQREVLTLYAAGFSQAEIAARLGQPLGTVKSRMRRALRQLRERLPAAGIDAGWPRD
jgi:RNA polymerase sigma-70 factor (ECF subfamily)